MSSRASFSLASRRCVRELISLVLLRRHPTLGLSLETSFRLCGLPVGLRIDLLIVLWQLGTGRPATLSLKRWTVTLVTSRILLSIATAARRHGIIWCGFLSSLGFCGVFVYQRYSLVTSFGERTLVTSFTVRR